MKDYNHKAIEPKWQRIWEKKKINVARENSKKPKFYGLIEFPYPSGDGLHVGHIRSNTAMDVISRKRRAEGFEVLYPIGWDAFGLPTENYAIKTGIHPIKVTKANTDKFRSQLKALGFSFDWSREVNTTDPAYYKWTQWIFLKFLEKGLAYKKKMAINWCPKDKIGLANEEVVDGCCERCGTPVEKREKEQWMLAITKYADRLDRDLDSKKILIGTRNPAKVKVIKFCLKDAKGIELVSLEDLPPVDDSALVEGDDFKENAKLKSEFYFKKTGIPTIATDHILWIEKWPENNGVMVHMRKHANPNSDRATDEEVLEFLKKFVNGVGGSSPANFHYAISFTDQHGSIATEVTPNNSSYILQTEQAKSFWPGYPTESLLKDAQTGVFKSDQSDAVRYSKVVEELNEKFIPRMLAGHTPIDYLEKIRLQQKNWIGRSEGSVITFALSQNNAEQTRNHAEKASGIEVFTTRPDTLFGATYLVLAPEHPILKNKNLGITNDDVVKKYQEEAKKKSEIERTADGKEKTGVKLEGIVAINPANQKEISVFVADYVLADYGTGAIMAVPAHDERDFEFAKKFHLPIVQVVAPKFVDPINVPQKDKKTVPRNTMHAIVRRKSDGAILMLHWKGEVWGKNPPKTFIIGGIDSGESVAEAAKREIHEETGYTDLKFIGQSDIEVHTEYFAAHKNENRYSKITAVYFDLESDSKDEVSAEEMKKHESVWIPADEVLSFVNVVDGPFIWNKYKQGEGAYKEAGVLVNSGKFDGMDSHEAKKIITEFAGGKMITTFKLRDWVFSRQRYWGEPIPVIHCEKCGIVPVPEKDLPVKLPNVENYKPTDTGESPLASISKWVNVKCPKCKGKAKRETDTMPNWAGSSWYYLRYTDSKNKKAFAGQKALQYWTPVDWYNGGMEHTTLHLLYSRFWHKFLFDLGLVPTSEPYLKRTSHGLILGEGGVKMSKSLGNVVNPDALIETFGADTLRLYEMFMGPFEQHIAWSTESMIGPRRFLERVWKLQLKVVVDKKLQADSLQLQALLHKTIKKVGEDIEAMRFNTAVSSMMVLLNEFEKATSVSKEDYQIFLQLLAPFAPHIAEELWLLLGSKKSIQFAPWPTFDPVLAAKGSGIW